MSDPTFERLRATGDVPKKKESKKESRVSAKGELSRDAKTKSSETTETKDGKTEEKTAVTPENSFSFKTTVGLPVLPGGKLGPFVFLDDLELTATASRKSAEPIPLGGTTLDDLDTKLAFKLIDWRVNNLIGASQELSLGAKSSFGDAPSSRTFGAATSARLGHEFKGSLGALKLSSTATFNASVTEVLGTSPGSKTSISGKGTAGVGYTSPPIPRLPGDTRFTAGLSASASRSHEDATATGTKDTDALSGSADLGLKTKLGEKSELTIKLTLTGDVSRSTMENQMQSTITSVRSGTLGVGTSISF